MRRTVITGIGVIAPNGRSPREFWDNANRGRSFIEADPEMEQLGIKSRVTCRIREFDPQDHMDSELARAVAGEDRFVQIGVAAGAGALRDSACLDHHPGTRVGAIYSSAIG
ncbi:MAG TPA: beta-ketoacyl synthase N-terminal-like domain-containing protein, partial [Polyangiaceae bacterium]|nr:beta-ketoacyl synthase N-terminal-like domain-containing protein [Polyangiaceae bacterium]